jgi:molybdate transport system substrate-binding protein
MLVLLPGCASEDGDAVVTVLAASSLSEAYEELAAQFESEHPGVDVRIVLGSSATLAQQVVEGAPGEVLATADERTMESASPETTEPFPFASNELVLLVRADNANAGGVDDLADLDSTEVTYVVCVPEAPCGALAERAIDDADLRTSPVSYEADAQAVVGKVDAGEVDAGFAYRTDAVGTDSLTAIALPSQLVTTYWIAALSGSAETELAQDFVALVLSGPGQAILAKRGLGAA